MTDIFDRTEKLIGADALEKLSGARVAVFGIGGVGGYVCEALARAGIGALDIVDADTVDLTNINRQIIALQSTVGRPKTEVMKERIADINPDCRVNDICTFVGEENINEFDFSLYDYVVDAVDTIAAKELLVLECHRAGTPIIASMGTGNKLDPTAFMVADIYETSVCPLAKVMRKRLRAQGIEHLKVVYSREEPVSSGSRTPASISFVPPAAGLALAGQVIRDLMEIEQ